MNVLALQATIGQAVSVVSAVFNKNNEFGCV